jgi:hypothetical protein
VHSFCCHFRHSRPREFLKAYLDLPLQGGFTGIFVVFYHYPEQTKSRKKAADY